MKAFYAIIAGLLLGLWTPVTHAGLRRWFVPTSLPAEIQVLNKSEEALDLWIGHPLAKDPELGVPTYEEYYSVLAQSKRRFSLEENRRHAWLQVKIQNENDDFLIVKLRKPNGETVELPRERAAIYSALAPTGYDKFTLSNLSELPQTVRVHWQSGPGIPVPDETVLLAAKGSLDVLRPANARGVEIRGELPLFAAWTTKDDFELMTPGTFPRYTRSTGTTRFLVANSAGDESFVIELADDALVARARQQIATPGRDPNTIIVGVPAYGPNGTNQNLLGPLQAPWSWHVKKVVGFSSIGSEACGGTAAVLEDLLQPWVDGEGGICFRDFRVVKELRGR